MARKSVDLTTLAGWSALAAKTYDITVVAKANGYIDSEPSAAVSVTKQATEADELAGTWVFNDRLFGGNLELLDIQFILNFDSSGSHLTGILLSQSTRPDNEIGFMSYDDAVGRVYFGDQFDEEDTTSDRWGTKVSKP